MSANKTGMRTANTLSILPNHMTIRAPSSASSAAYGLGRVPSATVSGVVGMMGSGGGGLSLQGSAMKLQWSVLFVQFLALVLTFY